MFYNLAITAAETVADTTSIFKTISIVGYILAAICLVLSIAIFFLYDIKGAYSYLSGKKQQKGISEMRKHQDDEKDGEFHASPSMKFGKTDSQKAKSGSVKKRTSSNLAPPPAPVAPPKPKEQPPQEQPPESKGDETAALGTDLSGGAFDSEGETGVLSSTNNASQSAESTQNNDSSENETSVLNANSALGTFIIVKNEMVIHTDEIL